MGYLVMVYTRDKKTAQKMVNRYTQGGMGAAVGMYYFPAKGIEMCPGVCDATTKKLNGWGRHSGLGFLTHACGRRHRKWKRHFIGALFDYLGVNLVPRARTPKLFQNPDTWGR